QIAGWLIVHGPLPRAEVKISRSNVRIVGWIAAYVGMPRPIGGDAEQRSTVGTLGVCERNDKRIGVARVRQQLVQPIDKADKARRRSLVSGAKYRREQHDTDLRRH